MCRESAAQGGPRHRAEILGEAGDRRVGIAECVQNGPQATDRVGGGRIGEHEDSVVSESSATP